VAKPRRQPSSRHALPDARLAEINQVAAGTGDDPALDALLLLRYRNGRRITYRRYDHLWLRIGRHLPWVATQGITAHWLRHTVITWVERTYSYAVARAFAGHAEGGDVGSTATYIKADLAEIAAAVAALTGEPHPLAPSTE